nr:uncharacterized protein LOC109158392 [Ipomoea batatas]
MRVNITYPTIVGWSAELARKRVREENRAGSFGRGTVLPRISKPADIAAATSRQNDQPPVVALNIPSSSVDKVTGILQKLASTVGEFGEAMAEIGKQGTPVNVMRKTFSGLSNMLNVASTIEATATPTSSQLDDIFFGSESFTTAVDALLQLDPTHEWMKRLPMEKKKQNFYERMTYEIERLQNLDINDADLIFFPVLRHGHYFLICINVKASKLEIIDNKSLVSGVTMKDKYGDCTTLLVTALKEYLALGSSALFWKVDELTEEVVDMSWKESENYIDCGLFVMRHMETYKGTLKKWNPGFKKKVKLNEEFLIGLRASSKDDDQQWSPVSHLLLLGSKLHWTEQWLSPPAPTSDVGRQTTQPDDVNEDSSDDGELRPAYIEQQQWGFRRQRCGDELPSLSSGGEQQRHRCSFPAALRDSHGGVVTSHGSGRGPASHLPQPASRMELATGDGVRSSASAVLPCRRHRQDALGVIVFPATSGGFLPLFLAVRGSRRWRRHSFPRSERAGRSGARRNSLLR